MFMKKTQKSNINEDYNSFRAKKVKFLHQGGDSLQKSLKHERNSSISKEKPLNNVTLKDLCPEDKAKIGELVKKFALEKKEKEELLVKLEEKQRFFEESIKEIRKENEQVALESHELQEKFKHSINLLKTLQKNELNKENLQTQEKKSPFKENILNFAGKI